MHEYQRVLIAMTLGVVVVGLGAPLWAAVGAGIVTGLAIPRRRP